MRKTVAHAVGFVLALAAAALVLPGRAFAQQPHVTLISVTPRGFAGNNASQGPAVSANGQFVAFWSLASDLLPPPAVDLNGFRDVYVRDTTIGLTQLISVSVTGGAGNGNSPNIISSPAISAEGRFVAFSSAATNLVDDDPNGSIEDIFVRDRELNVTERISVAPDGGGANGPSSSPSISYDGRFVAFQSNATNLIDGQTPTKTNVYVFDRDSGEMRRVSVAFDGGETDNDSTRPSISGNGLVVGFQSQATNLLASPLLGPQQVYVRILDPGTTELVSANNGGQFGNRSSFGAACNEDGSVIAFKSEASNLTASDTNGSVPDVFVRVRDGENSHTELVSLSNEGRQSNDISEFPGIDGTGNFVAFPNFDDFFDPNDGNRQSDIFVRDRANEKIARISLEIDNFSDGGTSIEPPGVSPEGQWIGFSDASSRLAPSDMNGTFDVFLACNPLKPPCPPLPPTATPTDTPSPTVTNTAAATATVTFVPTVTPTPTPTRTNTPTVTVTSMSTATVTHTQPTSTQTPIHCENQDDCPDDLVCIDGMCVPPPPCDTQDDCPDDLVCIDGMCVPPPPCDTQDDCPDDLVCIDGMCVPPPPCDTQDDCPDDLVCIDGMCKPCEMSSQCPDGGTCVDGMCVAPTPTPTPPGGGGGGGGGCSCEIDPAQRSNNVFEGLSLMAPAVLLWAARRRSRVKN